MAEEIITQILGYSIGGISLATLLGMFIAFLKDRSKARKEKEITKQGIVDGFKEVIIPKDLRINLSNKVKPSVKEAIGEYMEPITKAYQKLEAQNYLMLKIMSKFTHAEQLTEDEQTKLRELLKDESISEIEIS